MGFGLTKQQRAMIMVLMFGTFIAVLNQTLVAPALPSVMKEMLVDQSTAQWLTTGFTLVNAIMIPVTAFLLEKYSIRQLFLSSMAIFSLGSFLCCVAPGFYLLLLGRLIQALGAGVMQPLVMVVLLRTFPLEKRGTAMGIFGLVIAFAPAIGPTAAGIIIDHFGWRHVFWFIVVLAILELVGSYLALPHDEAKQANLPLDKPSVVLSTIGFGSLLYGFSEIGSHGLRVSGVITSLVGLIALISFFRRQLKLPKPMLEVRVLKNRAFLAACLLTMVVQGALISGSILLPIFMQNDLGLSATESGLLMLPSAVVMGIMSPISGKIFDKHGPRLMTLLGMLVMTLGTAALCTLSLKTGFLYLIILYTFRMIGLALVNMPINTWGMNALPDELISHGTSVINTLRQVAGSLGTALIVSTASVVERYSRADLPAIEASIKGINSGFFVATLLCFIGLCIVIFFVKQQPQLLESTKARQNRTLIEKLMQPEVYCISKDAQVVDALRLMIEKGVSSLPLVDAQGKLAGFISDGDIMRYLSKSSEVIIDPITAATYILETGQEHKGFEDKLDELMSMKLSGLCSSQILSVDIHDDLVQVCRVLGAHRLKKVPVLDGDKIVGVIKRAALVRFALDSYLEKTRLGIDGVFDR